ncbi:hypothetical protein CDL12_13973 [Handroanthus impetiginosus]|uniref:Uncharacterized protein n=1 Tax=Handroanthus impetiginosus TaxID=429701 RepID=A0A2G9H7B4_9LAMI|nr:hypothetical protein CDL12_13973 [Handroanthus impetiginosus]
MSVRDVDQIVVEINQKLGNLAFKSSKSSIFKVDIHLRIDGGDSVYDPEIVAIGPYHRGKSHLQYMEEQKYRYLRRLLNRENEEIISYINVVVAMEERARKCYAEPTYLSSNEFLIMMVVDACFLIELIRSYGIKELRDDDDPIFRQERILSQLRHDIFLLENQLPFFLLNELFNMTKINDPKDDIITLTLRFADSIFLNFKVPEVVRKIPINNIDHIFGLVHWFLCFPFTESIPAREKHARNHVSDKWANIYSISGLREAGIKIERAEEKSSLLDITFKDGVLKIPRLKIFDETESQLRNLTAYEQYLSDGEPRYVSELMFFMHCLIKTPYDAKLLRCRGIIENWFAKDENVCLMFNRIGKNILTSSNFSYSQIFRYVNKQCSRRHIKWRATLRRNYFNSPWSIISFLAAAMLLLLTLLQTIYTILSYKHRSDKTP